MNSVALVGRMTRDPELRQTTNGISYVFFTLAVDRGYTSRSGESTTDFIPCVAWRGTAETIAQYTSRGSRIGVLGSIQVRSYDDASGARRNVVEVSCDRFYFLESRAEAQARQERQDYGDSPSYRPQPKPSYKPSYQSNQTYKSQSQPTQTGNDPFADIPDIGDDDLPF